MKNCSGDKNVLLIQGIYPELEIGCYQETFLGTITVFTIFSDTQVLLEEHWKDVYNSIAAYFQPERPAGSEFEKWNIYLLYICKEAVRKELQYKIENDRFAARKIVLGNFSELIDDGVVSQLIGQQITNADLEISPEVKQVTESFKNDGALSEVMSRYKLSGGTKKSEIDMAKILMELENKFSDEV